MGRREGARQLDTHGAHGDVDGARAQRARNAVLTERDIANGVVIGKHGDDHFAIRASLGHSGRLPSPELHKGCSLLCAAVEHRDLVPGLHEIGCHARTHLAESDEADLHVMLLTVRSKSR